MATRHDRALITGASRGIGEGFARHLAARGSDLVLVARSEDALRSLADELAGDHGVDTEVLTADLSTDDGRGAVERRLGTTPPVDLFVNNAGVGLSGPFVDDGPAAHGALLEVNAVAAVRLAHAAAVAMRRRGGGDIINVSSVTSFQPGPFAASYAATKALLRSLSEAVHEEVAGDGIRVLALCPGFTRTEIVARAGADPGAIPRPLWSQIATVVATALRDLERGVAVSVPGALNRVVATVSPRTPDGIRRRMAALFSRRL